jgi:hypothetical protein
MACSFSLIQSTFSIEGALLQFSYTILDFGVLKYCEEYFFLIRILSCMFLVHLPFWDPEKYRTGSFFPGGGFLRRLLYVVVQSADLATRYRVPAAEVL